MARLFLPLAILLFACVDKPIVPLSGKAEASSKVNDPATKKPVVPLSGNATAKGGAQ